MTTPPAPIMRRCPLPGAPAAFAALETLPYPFWLDSRTDPQRLGRFSFLGADPFLVMSSHGRDIRLRQAGQERRLEGDPFALLADALTHYRLQPAEYAVPFLGGAVGYLAYDLRHFIERLPSRALDDLRLPECYLAFYDVAAAYDHLTGETYLVSSGWPERDALARERRAQERLEWLGGLLARASEPASEPPAPRTAGGLRGNFTHRAYLDAVERAREYIAAGDIFQVNLSQRFDAPLALPPPDLYRRVRSLNPAPFAAYLGFPEVAVISSSPERFVRLSGDKVETRPIKGTRPRGRDAASDAAMAQELVESVKDRAEHVMIVDLERNDIGRVCSFGSVRVSELMALETYATVFHLTSTVEGRLRPDAGPVDLLRATFPGGSITGAPKVRAMEIIDELEPTRRSVYTGAIGYLSFHGDLDLNIVIRTILAAQGRAFLQVGGAVVYDSDPEGEYQETLDKGRALMRALGVSDEQGR